MGNRKYTVYIHKVDTDDGPMYYVGCTCQKLSKRWHPHHYMCTSLRDYIEMYGWRNIEHFVVGENLTYEDAKRREDEWIVRYQKIGRAINIQRSGLYCTMENAAREARKADRDRLRAEIEAEKEEKRKRAYKGGDEKYKEYQLAYMRNVLKTPEGKIYNRVADYNRRHPDRAVETALEARDKYRKYGTVPNYIKNDDL